MSLEAYTNPDFGMVEKIIFLAASLAAMILCVALIIGGAAIVTARMDRREKKKAFNIRTHTLVQLFYEMMISATSVMSFASAYVILNHIYSLCLESGSMGDAGLEAFMMIWGEWKDFVLLLLICLSCVLNTILDKLIIPLKNLTREEKASIRLLGMFYAILILVWLNKIGDESEYSPVVMYYLGLMIGRFVYFDASFSDFLHNIVNAFKNLPLLIMGLASTSVLCIFGFGAGYLLERNYYIVGVFYTHLFMLAAVFIIHHSHLLSLIAGSAKNARTAVEDELLHETGYEDSGYEDSGRQKRSYRNGGYDEDYNDYRYDEDGADDYGYGARDYEDDGDFKWMN